mmetsp:Transcript_94550/g.267105  ORF Transcript_94550/g.267105 Transcript_94550/m.267105 type:complete len:209 (-) Transcript_94550:189-815(-)
MQAVRGMLVQSRQRRSARQLRARGRADAGKLCGRVHGHLRSTGGTDEGRRRVGQHRGRRRWADREPRRRRRSHSRQRAARRRWRHLRPTCRQIHRRRIRRALAVLGRGLPLPTEAKSAFFLADSVNWFTALHQEPPVLLRRSHRVCLAVTRPSNLFFHTSSELRRVRALGIPPMVCWIKRLQPFVLARINMPRLEFHRHIEDRHRIAQ